jgi:hypothetical protein
MTTTTVNVQAWVPAIQTATIAKYMELTGMNSRQLADIARVGIEVLFGILKQKGFAFESEADALRYLENRGFRVASRKDKQKKVIEALQQEALLEYGNKGR